MWSGNTYQRHGEKNEWCLTVKTMELTYFVFRSTFHRSAPHFYGVIEFKSISLNMLELLIPQMMYEK